jgi:hypothetical protein
LFEAFLTSAVAIFFACSQIVTTQEDASEDSDGQAGVSTGKQVLTLDDFTLAPQWMRG